MAFVHPSFKEKAIYTFNQHTQYTHKICLIGFVYYYHKLSTKLWKNMFLKNCKSQNKINKKEIWLSKWDLAMKFDNMT
jgi:hypothetical protein